MCPKSENNICQRIAQVRLEQDGARGKSRFAKKLGISPSTYDYYESSRVPPADLLVKIAEVAHVDLRWLLTGEAGGAGDGVTPQHPAVKRAAEMLANNPDAAEPLAAFLDILAATLEFPAKDAIAGGAGDSDAPAAAQKQQQPVRTDAPAVTAQDVPAAPADPKADWIPILGRSAAGVPQFWDASDDTSGLTTLTELIEKHSAATDEQMDIRPAVITSDLQQNIQQKTAPESVGIITLRTPDDSGVVEFVAAGRIKTAYKDAFAVRIDGESMSPEIRHGDLLILSPSIPAAANKPAVIQIRDAIGVTCKLYNPSAAEPNAVTLVAINEQFPSRTIKLDDIQWALCVIAKIQTRG